MASSFFPFVIGIFVYSHSRYHRLELVYYCLARSRQICTMYYHFDKDENEKCMLICGDVGGNVRVLLFSPVKRGPFRNEAGRALIQLRHVDLQRKVSQ